MTNEFFETLTETQRTDLMIAGDIAEEVGLRGTTEVLRGIAGEGWLPTLVLNRKFNERSVHVDGESRQLSIVSSGATHLRLFGRKQSGHSAGVLSDEESTAVVRVMSAMEPKLDVIDTLRWLYYARLNLVEGSRVAVCNDCGAIGTWVVQTLEEGMEPSYPMTVIEMRLDDASQ
ncbi:hypothetical protein OAH18_03185 [bacterium]|nr:hypothetical protein [bacterium]